MAALPKYPGDLFHRGPPRETHRQSSKLHYAARQIILILAASILLSALGGGYLYLSSQISNARNRSHAEAVKTLNGIKRVLTARFSARRQEAKLLATVSAFQISLTKRDIPSIAAANGALVGYKDILDVEACYIMDSSGDTIASSNYATQESFIGKNYRFRPYFTQAMDGKNGMYLALGITSKVRGVYFGEPIPDTSTSSPLGVLVVKDTLEDLDEELLDQFDEGHALLTDPHGVIFASSASDWLFHLLWEISPDEIKALTESQQFGKGPREWLGVRLDGEHHAINSSGQKFMVHRVGLPDLPGWELIYLHDLKILTETVYDKSLKIALATIISICLLVGVLSFLLYRKASQDLNQLNAITEALGESEERFRGAFEAAAHGMAFVGLDGKWLKANESLGKITGYGCEELIESDFQTITHPEDLELDLNQARRLLAGEIHYYHMEKRYIHKQGHPVWVLLSVSLVRDSGGNPLYFVSQVIDISRRKKLEQQLREISVTDELTGLLNRRGFLDLADKQLNLAERLQGAVYLFFADLDNMKFINDRFGHKTGDEALKETADILRSTFRQTDILCRLGGDEFAALLLAQQGEDTSVVTRRFESKLKTVNSKEDRKYALGISYGIIPFDPNRPATITDLLNQADSLMYKSKQRKKDSDGARI